MNEREGGSGERAATDNISSGDSDPDSLTLEDTIHGHGLRESR
jgi:hypothetical protein